MAIESLLKSRDLTDLAEGVTWILLNADQCATTVRCVATEVVLHLDGDCTMDGINAGAVTLHLQLVDSGSKQTGNLGR
jgi:hypothetical protein